jgi:hypothetical protein
MEATIIAETEARFRADPSAAKSTPTVTATLVNGRARLSAGPFNWDADLPAALGGENLAPSPTAYLLGALAGCAVAFLHDTLAPGFDVQIDDVTAVACCSTDAAFSGSTASPRTWPTSRSRFVSPRRRRRIASMRCSPPGVTVARSTWPSSSRNRSH